MNPHAITLRLAEPRDAHLLALMSREYVESGLGWKYDAARLRHAIADRDTIVLAACEANRIAGFAVMAFSDERAHLVLLAVQPALRRRGIGRRLLQWLVESAQTAGVESMHLELRVGNSAAQRFYRAMGFSETLVVPGYYGGKEPALRMLRMLRGPIAAPYVWRPPHSEA